MNIIEIDPNGGRRITSSGKRDLDQEVPCFCFCIVEGRDCRSQTLATRNDGTIFNLRRVNQMMLVIWE